MVTEAATWWPSRYGADDQAGALNEIGPDNVVGAARLVRQGRVYDLAHVLHMDVPAFEGRMFCQELDAPAVGARTSRPRVRHRAGPRPSQMGTHLDALNHLHKDGRTYNGHRIADITASYGTTRLGADTLPQIVTRGLLVDVAARRGVARLDAGDVITPDDVAGLDVRPGDAVLFHTGWGELWHEDPATYGSGEPGPGMALAEWLADHRVALHGLRHVELRAGAGRGPRSALRRPPDPQHPPRRDRGREPLPRATSLGMPSPSSCS